MICMNNQKYSMSMKKGPTISNLCQGEFYWVNSRNIPEYVSHALYYQLQFLPLLCPNDRQANWMWWGLRTDAENLTEYPLLRIRKCHMLQDLCWQKSMLGKVQHQSWVVKWKKQVETVSALQQNPAASRSPDWELTFVLKPQRMLYTATKLLMLGNCNTIFWARRSQHYWRIKIKLR